MINESKLNDPRFWAIWKASGALGTIEDARKVGTLDYSKRESKRKDIGNFGFNQVYRLTTNQKYEGTADRVMLIWNELQIVPAEQYRKANFGGIKTDIAICQNPNVQFAQLDKERAVIYHFN